MLKTTHGTPGAEDTLSIVVPTFREVGNIPTLAERIDAALAETGIKWELLLVDDDSGDGSEEAVHELARRLPVRIVVRRDGPRDLSLAVLEGIRQCRFDRLVVMDADLSHPPERIADMLADLARDCDMVIGSRYTLGGAVDRSWSLYRLLNSRLATWMARPLVDCADPMSGFFATRRSALPELGGLRPMGYKIALELMVRGRLRVREIPIDFHDRSVGSSKMNWRQQVRFLRHLSRLYDYRFGSMARIPSFSVVGASGLMVDLACYLGLQWAGVEHRLARFLSFWPAVSWNWALNRGFTYSGRERQPHLEQWARFAASSVIGLGVNVGSYALLTSYVALFGRHRLWAFFLGVALGSVVNFVVADLYVYRKLPPPER
ncbi:MAG: glycosyltransferase family 2 protein [Deltaproteobacteria bacterium]|nr:glycosyltransferase family 2 protein [Deltaproteobacteria bacterium]